MAALTADVQTPVKIHLTTNICLDGEEETFEMILFGQYYRKNNAVFLKYDEVQEEGTVHTLVKVDDEEATIFRKGIINMRMKFRLNEQKDGSHASEYGSLLLSTDTNKLAHHEYDDKCEGKINLGYDLYMQGTHAGKYDMEIQYREETGNL
ncbi:DUF1934 domain-containing protein [Siminovitchia fortis]|uniref:DUF1934 domain-containing protein n=1 Tax=Siminovitchia fortis TaxID=254758 RepID=UPI001FD3F13A|nr:DUF1934 domain-containing protein [Siminovitchia fortis]WHY81673.1 DUF1934 domain-containing protein [Siminovitchia fortis]